jgi:hydrogenase expression/formation protein HypE
LATTLNEIASDRNVCIKLEEALIPVDEVVQGACEILGIDPLYVANEGQFAVIVPSAQAEVAVGCLKSVDVSQSAVSVGRVEESPGRMVLLQSRVGGTASSHAQRRTATQSLLMLQVSQRAVIPL